MGDIIGGLIGGVGSLVGGSSAKKQDLTGFNYLTGKNGTQSFVNNGATANNAATSLLTGTQTPGQSQAFGNYLNSAGYQFQKQQGTAAITGNAASRGLLNSGATGKALVNYGTNLANTNFNNYLGQLQGVAGQGLQASGQIGQAGTAGGVAAGSDQGNGIANAAGTFGRIASNIFGA